MAELVQYPLSEQVALITGGGSGIGRAIAESLMHEGARVIIASRRSDLLHRVAGEMNSKYPRARAYPYVFDLRDRWQTERLVEWALETFGHLDLLVNNSGVADQGGLSALDEQAWNYVIETNLRGAMWLIRAALPRMVERNFGDIVNIVSQAGRHGYSDVPAYCASKHGIIGLARAVDDQLRKEQRNVRVFNLCPSLVDVDHTGPQEEPRPGTMHVRTLAKTFMFCLGLDRSVRLSEIDLTSAF